MSLTLSSTYCGELHTSTTKVVRYLPVTTDIALYPGTKHTRLSYIREYQVGST
jgi:hypothetical protein